jgi:hypothetical protein
MKEYIICAANHYNDDIIHIHQPINITSGFVIGGRRHHNCIYTFKLMMKDINREDIVKLMNKCIQGFITNTNRFVNRQEAYKIAFEANQIIGPNKGYATNIIGLTSEDLY